MAVRSATLGVPVILQDGSIIGNGKVLAIPSSFRNHTFLIRGSLGVSAGAVQLENAHAYDYSGTWAKIGAAPVTVVADAEVMVTFEGILSFVRARISTTISGGATPAVTVTYVGY